jgi:hypothetical protein
MNQNIKILIIILIICLLLAHLMSIHLNNKNEYFKNIPTKKNTTNCDCYDSINHKDKLITPVAVNIPIDNAVFNTVHNINDIKTKKSGNYCFPIEKYLYDGVWNSNKDNINTTPNKQTCKWDLKNKKHISDIYCANKFIIVPEKNMNPGDVVCSKKTYSELNPSKYQISERLQDKCIQNNLFTGVMKTTYNYYTINGL